MSLIKISCNKPMKSWCN